MANNRLKFETSEEFKNKVVEEFLPTLPHTVPCKVVGCTFPNIDICRIQLLTQQGMQVYSVWRDKTTKLVDYCQGEISKPPAKDIN